MSDSKISNYKHQGQTYLWRYQDNPRNYKGWHMSCNIKSAEAFKMLFKLFKQSEFGGNVNIDLVQNLNECPGVEESLKPLISFKLNIKYSPIKFNANHWQLYQNLNTTFLELGCDQLSNLEEGIDDTQKDNGDYSIGIDNEELWFW